METTLFAVNGELFTEPYLSCIRDISGGLPVKIALESYGLDGAHKWKMDALVFYTQAREARRFSITQVLSQLDQLAVSGQKSEYLSAPARILMWKAEQLMKDGKYLSDILERLQAVKFAGHQRSAEENILKGVGYSDEVEPESYYAKYGAH